MTTRVEFNGPEHRQRLYVYRAWMTKNLFVPGEAKTWAFLNEEHGRWVNAVLFLNEEDATAFKLRFGL